MIFHKARIDVVQLSNAHGSRLSAIDLVMFRINQIRWVNAPHVGVIISHALAQRFAQVLSDFVDANAAHGADGKCANKWVGIFTVFDERVDCHDGEIRLRFGVVHEIEICKHIDTLIKYCVHQREVVSDQSHIVAGHKTADRLSSHLDHHMQYHALTNELLQLHVVRLHAVDDISEQWAEGDKITITARSRLATHLTSLPTVMLAIT